MDGHERWIGKHISEVDVDDGWDHVYPLIDEHGTVLEIREPDDDHLIVDWRGGEPYAHDGACDALIRTALLRPEQIEPAFAAWLAQE